MLDTSVFIASETGRPLHEDRFPEESYVSAVTLAELEVGVLAATDVAIRSRRLTTFRYVAALVTLPVDETAASHWARLRVALHDASRRANLNDVWIASVALAHGLPVVTQDDDFDVLADLGLLPVVKV